VKRFKLLAFALVALALHGRGALCTDIREAQSSRGGGLRISEASAEAHRLQPSVSLTGADVYCTARTGLYALGVSAIGLTAMALVDCFSPKGPDFTVKVGICGTFASVVALGGFVSLCALKWAAVGAAILGLAKLGDAVRNTVVTYLDGKTAEQNHA